MAHAVAVSMFIDGREDWEIEQATEQLTLLWTNALGMSAGPETDAAPD